MEKRNIFILNPAAGQGKAVELKDDILKAAKELSLDVEIYHTKEELYGEVLANQLAKTATKDKPIRLFACGGDGTLNEILNGIVGYEHVEVGVLPLGTGNDFVRNFSSPSDFLNIKNQLLGESVDTDIIKYRWDKDDYHCERYCINMFNIGFDCNVVDAAAHLKKRPMVSGSMAYLAGVVQMLIKMKGANLKVEFENGSVFEDKMLLIAIANGCFCGGGVKGVPKAVTNDGFMDVSIVKTCSRSKFLKLFPRYMKGTHLETKAAKDLVIYKKCKTLSLTKREEPIMFSTDGEITYADSISFEIKPKEVKFIVPKFNSH